MTNKEEEKELTKCHAITNTSSTISHRFINMTEPNYWLMKSERVYLLVRSQGINIFYPNFTQTFLNLKLKPLKIFFW